LRPEIRKTVRRWGKVLINEQHLRLPALGHEMPLDIDDTCVELAQLLEYGGRQV